MLSRPPRQIAPGGARLGLLDQCDQSCTSLAAGIMSGMTVLAAAACWFLYPVRGYLSRYLHLLFKSICIPTCCCHVSIFVGSDCYDFYSFSDFYVLYVFDFYVVYVVYVLYVF